MDELWANVCQEGQEVWLWVVLEATTRIIPMVKLGPRTLEMAYGVVHELCQRRESGPLPVFSRDGLHRKMQRRRLVKVEHHMRWGKFEMLKSGLKTAGPMSRLNKAFIERLNLTLRPGVALLTRHMCGSAQRVPKLALHVEGWRACCAYHFVRYREALRVELSQPVRRRGSKRPVAITIRLRKWRQDSLRIDGLYRR